MNVGSYHLKKILTCAMEDVLEVYHREYLEDEVLVCMDETSKQHVKEMRTLLPQNSVEKYDYEYERNGVSNLFMLSAPLEGWRHVEVTDRHNRLGKFDEGFG